MNINILQKSLFFLIILSGLLRYNNSVVTFEKNWFAYGPTYQVNFLTERNGVLYLGVNHGVDYYDNGCFISKDTGKTWRNYSEGLSFNSIDYIWFRQDTIFASAGTGIYYRTEDTKWQKTILNYNFYSRLLYINKDTVIACESDKFMFSFDYGRNWITKKTDISTYFQVYAKTATGIYFAENDQKIIKYDFKKKKFINVTPNWNLININTGWRPQKQSSLFFEFNNKKIIDPIIITSICQIQDTVYVLLEDQRLFKTKNSNDDWETCNTNFLDTSVYTLNVIKNKFYFFSPCEQFVTENLKDKIPLQSPLSGKYISNFYHIYNYYFAVTDLGLYRSKDGVNWENSSTGIFNPDVLHLVTVGDEEIVTQNNGSGLLINNTSKNKLWEDFTNLNDRLWCYLNHENKLSMFNFDSYTFLMDLSNRRYLLISYPKEVKNVTCIKKVGTDIFIGTSMAGIFQSNDFGATWRRVYLDTINYDIPANIKHYYIELEMPDFRLPLITRRILSIFQIKDKIVCSTNYGFLISDDIGKTWRNTHDTLINKENLEYYSYENRIFAIGSYYMVYSLDAAENWTYKALPNYGSGVLKYSVYKNNIYLLFKNGKIAHSNNFGESWKLLNMPPYASEVNEFKANDKYFYILNWDFYIDVIPINK